MKLRLLEMEALHGKRKSGPSRERKPAADLKMSLPVSLPADVLPKSTLPKSLTRFFPRRSAK